jgi:hypothetical protein
MWSGLLAAVRIPDSQPKKGRNHDDGSVVGSSGSFSVCFVAASTCACRAAPAIAGVRAFSDLLWTWVPSIPRLSAEWMGYLQKPRSTQFQKTI